MDLGGPIGNKSELRLLIVRRLDAPFDFMTTIDDFSPPIPIPQYPNRPGVYVIVGDDGKVLYVGSSKQLCRRASHLTALQHDATNDAGFSHIKAGVLRKYQEQGHKAGIRFFPCEDYLSVERRLIATHKPPWNKR